MASVNKAIIVGNLGQDPDIRYLPNGDAVANLSIATTDSWKDKDGNKQEATEWHRVSFFGRSAEVCGQYLKKGSQVYVEGSIKTRKWQDKEGNDRYTTEIRGDRMQMLGGRGAGTHDATPKQETKPGANVPAAEYVSGGVPPNFDDDIPFAPIGRGIRGHAI